MHGTIPNQNFDVQSIQPLFISIAERFKKLTEGLSDTETQLNIKLSNILSILEEPSQHMNDPKSINPVSFIDELNNICDRLESIHEKLSRDLKHLNRII